MQVNLIEASDNQNIEWAARTCTDTIDKMTKDINDNLILNLIKRGHTSVLEHLSYMFEIKGISRACLQELVRHRMASYSVKSTRWTLHKLKNENKNLCRDEVAAEEYLVFTGNEYIDTENCYNLHGIISMLQDNIPNDIAKYALPEAFKTDLIMTINCRSLRNFLRLRSSKRALWEIRKLAENIYEALPEEDKIYYEDVYKGE